MVLELMTVGNAGSFDLRIYLALMDLLQKKYPYVVTVHIPELLGTGISLIHTCEG